MNPGASNRLLAALPQDLQARLSEDLHPVSLRRSEQLMRRGHPIEYIYFPTSCLISLVVNFTNGNVIEAMVIGSDGWSGFSTLFNSSIATTDAMVQIAGDALRMETKAFWRHLEDSRLRDHLGNYVELAFSRIAQATGCVAFHPLEQRLSRWLLQVSDATEQRELPLTHEFLGVMLGVHRPTVTLAIRTLENAGVIHHARGRITISNFEGLRETACECYRLGGSPE